MCILYFLVVHSALRFFKKCRIALRKNLIIILLLLLLLLNSVVRNRGRTHLFYGYSNKVRNLPEKTPRQIRSWKESSQK